MEGTLESIECGSGGVRVTLSGTTIGPKQFGAASLTAIEFISYRDDVRGGASCGAQQPMTVLLTWRARRGREGGVPAGVDSVVVAIEYIPR
jgi:hypothetical protein